MTADRARGALAVLQDADGKFICEVPCGYIVEQTASAHKPRRIQAQRRRRAMLRRRVALIITAFVIPWIRSKTTAAQFEKIKMWVTVAVEAAEQLYTGSGRGAEKKAYVVEFLNSKGFKIDAETLDKLIEAAVFNLPDYFTISGIPADTDSNKE